MHSECVYDSKSERANIDLSLSLATYLFASYLYHLPRVEWFPSSASFVIYAIGHSISHKPSLRRPSNPADLLFVTWVSIHSFIIHHPADNQSRKSLLIKLSSQDSHQVLMSLHHACILSSQILDHLDHLCSGLRLKLLGWLAKNSIEDWQEFGSQALDCLVIVLVCEGC